MTDKNWNEFWNSGSIFDYLKYKDNEKVQQDEYFDKGISNQRTNNWGE